MAPPAAPKKYARIRPRPGRYQEKRAIRHRREGVEIMASGVVGDLQSIFGGGTVAGLTDGQLLARFAAGRPEEAEPAFAALVARHGTMVLGVCRSLLRNAHDAEDA